MITQSGSRTRLSTHTGIPSGSPKTVTPPISIPVQLLGLLCEAKLALRTPSRRRTIPFTSRRVVASTRQAATWPSGFREATRMVLADRSRGTS